MNKKINLQDVKQALLDDRFRSTLPEELSEDVEKFLKNPGCLCNHPVYKKILSIAPDQLAKYYPNKSRIDIQEIEKEIEKTSENNWIVINCNINELSENLKKLPRGRMNLDIARFQDQVTVVVNHLDSF